MATIDKYNGAQSEFTEQEFPPGTLGKATRRGEYFKVVRWAGDTVYLVLHKDIDDLLDASPAGSTIVRYSPSKGEIQTKLTPKPDDEIGEKVTESYVDELEADLDNYMTPPESVPSSSDNTSSSADATDITIPPAQVNAETENNSDSMVEAFNNMVDNVMVDDGQQIEQRGQSDAPSNAKLSIPAPMTKITEKQRQVYDILVDLFSTDKISVSITEICEEAEKRGVPLSERGVSALLTHLCSSCPWLEKVAGGVVYAGEMAAPQQQASTTGLENNTAVTIPSGSTTDDSTTKMNDSGTGDRPASVTSTPAGKPDVSEDEQPILSILNSIEKSTPADVDWSLVTSVMVGIGLTMMAIGKFIVDSVNGKGE